jgi:two-component system phosphate regulon sensor histidine kinase PhoR
MKHISPFFLLPPTLALLGVVVCCALLWNQTTRFKRSVEKIAEDVRVSLIDLDGKVVYDSAGKDLPNHADRAEFEAVRADGQPRSIVRESETLHISMFYFAKRIGDYVLRISVPYQSVTDAKADAVRGLLSALGTGALIVAALFFFTRRYEQRLSRLAAEHDLQEKMMEEMRKLERFRSNFISNVTHEIRTPVTGILGATEMLADDAEPLDGKDRAELQNVLKSHSLRLVALVDDILALARLEKAEAEHDASFAPCDVADIVQTAVNLVRSTARNAGISLTFVRKPQDAKSFVRPCDARLIESAVTNLMQNALRHSGSKDVEISVEKTSSGKAAVSVIDHGIGIPEECQPRLFERFYRIDKNRSRSLGGTGLGLAIVKHIAQLHGGEVKVSSRPGEGTTFTLVI